jgi:hypothetical protein
MGTSLNRAIVLVIAVAIWIPGPAPVRADEETDLKIELTGKPSGNNKRQVTFTVTNISTMWAKPTTAHIETVSPGSANATNPDPVVGELDPGQSRTVSYTLAGDCNGHVVKAVVKPAGNWDDKLEVQTANNTFQGSACEATGGGPGGAPGGFDPASVGVIARPSDNLTVIPQRIRSGLHADGGTFPAEELAPSVARGNHLKSVETGLLGDLTCPIVGQAGGDDAFVGYAFFDNAGCNLNLVSQFVVNFDLDWLRAERNNVTKATLVFNEKVTVASNDAGENTSVATCIGRLGIAPANFADVIAGTQLITSGVVEGDLQFIGVAGPSEWDVTRDIRWTSTGANEKLTGFVFHGGDENLNAETDRRCGSELAGIRLKVQYEVFP